MKELQGIRQPPRHRTVRCLHVALICAQMPTKGCPLHCNRANHERVPTHRPRRWIVVSVVRVQAQANRPPPRRVPMGRPPQWPVGALASGVRAAALFYSAAAAAAAHAWRYLTVNECAHLAFVVCGHVMHAFDMAAWLGRVVGDGG